MFYSVKLRSAMGLRTENMTSLTHMLSNISLCASPSVVHCPAVETNQWYAITASFGKMSGNKTISQVDIDNFLRNVVMPRFDRFKVTETRGVWKSQAEDSFDIFVLSDDLAKAMKKMTDVCLLYKATFAQDSVLLFYEKASVLFL